MNRLKRFNEAKVVSIGYFSDVSHLIRCLIIQPVSTFPPVPLRRKEITLENHALRIHSAQCTDIEEFERQQQHYEI